MFSPPLCRADTEHTLRAFVCFLASSVPSRNHQPGKEVSQQELYDAVVYVTKTFREAHMQSFQKVKTKIAHR